MDLTLVVSRVVDPGPPAVVEHGTVHVSVPDGVPAGEVAQVLRRAQHEAGTSVDVLL